MIASIYGLWTFKWSGSDGSAAFAFSHTSTPCTPGLASSSAYEPIASILPVCSQTQIGSGVPHQRSRESAQSTLFRRKSPKRPSRMCSGNHWIAALFLRNSSLNWLVRTNQLLRAYWMSGSSSDRGQNGYSCSIVSW